METLQTLWRSIDWELLGSLISRVLAVFLCLTVHETCHGLAAYALGDPTAKRQHRLSFNPLRHIDWLGFASMLIVGFGWAKPVPVDMRYFKKPKQGMAITALAGPVSNFLLAVLCLLPVGWIYWHAQVTTFTLWLYNFLINVVILSIGLGLVQSSAHPAPGRVQGAVCPAAGPAVLEADALRAVRHAGAAGAGGL